MTRWMRGPELDRPRDREPFDPVAEGARYHLPRELSLALWERVCADATDAAGRCDLAQAQQRFHDLAARIAARAGRLHPDVGKLTRVGVERNGAPYSAAYVHELSLLTAGRQTLVTAEAQRWQPAPGTVGVPGRQTLVTAEAHRWPTTRTEPGTAPEGTASAPQPHEPPGAAEVARAMAAVLLPQRTIPTPAGAFPPARDSVREQPPPTATLGRMERMFGRHLDTESHRAPAPPPQRGARFDDFLALGFRDVLQAAIAHAGQRSLHTLSGAENPAVARAGLPGMSAPWLRGGAEGRALWRAAERHAATLYRRAVDLGEVDHGSPAVDAALQRCGSGQPLTEQVRHTMEARLGVPLDRVRIHTDRVAAEAAHAVSAEAFTVGEDIFFAEGAYAPESREGQRLLAHELTHVVQAWQGRTSNTGRVSTPGDSLEHEAETVADRVDRGEPASRSGSPAVGPISVPLQTAQAASPATPTPQETPTAPRTPSAQPLLRRAARVAGTLRGNVPETRGGAHPAPAKPARQEIHDTASDVVARARQGTKQATRKLRDRLREAQANPPGKRALELVKHDTDRGRAHEHEARAVERQHHARARARAAHSPEARQPHGGKHEAVDTRSPIKFKPITEWSKHMPEPLPDQDERERKRIERLVKTKIDGDRKEAKHALEKLRAAHLQKAREIRAMKPRLLAQIAAAQKRALAHVAASESSQCAAVQRHVATVQGQVRGHAAAMKGQVSSAHAAALAKINATHHAAQEKCTHKKAEALSDVANKKTDAIVALELDFIGLHARFSALGHQKAGDAIAVGEDEAGKMSGRWHGDKLEAAQKAARDTADGFATAMPEQAEQKFHEIDAKRPPARAQLEGRAAVAKAHIEHTYDSAKASIDAARKSSLHAADAARSAAMAQIDQACASAVASLAAQGASQVAAIRKQAQAARAGLLRAGAAGRASTAHACERTAAGIERGIVGLIRGARSIEAPDPDHTRQQVLQGGKALAQGASAAARGLTATATGSSQGLATQASGAAQGMASTASAAQAGATQTGAGARQQISAIAHGAIQGLHETAETHKTMTDKTVSVAESGITKQVHKLDDKYRADATKRQGEFIGNFAALQTGLNSAVPPMGKGGGAGSGKKAEGGGKGGGESKTEIASIEENAKKAADAVKPWWQKALAVVVSVVVAIVVVIAVTALIGATGPLGAILVGAAAGALSSAAGTMAQNLVLGNNMWAGISVKSVLMGAAAGALGAGLTEGLSAGAKALAGSTRFGGTALGRGAGVVKAAMAEGEGAEGAALPQGEKTLGQKALKTGIETATDTVGDGATNLIFDGKLNLSAQDLLMSAATNAATGTKKFEAFQRAIQKPIRVPFHLTIPKVQVQIGTPRSPAGSSAHGGGGSAHPSGPTTTTHGGTTGHGASSTPHHGSAGGHTDPAGAGHHGSTTPASTSHAGATPRTGAVPATPPHGAKAAHGDATARSPHGDADPAKTHGDAGHAKADGGADHPKAHGDADPARTHGETDSAKNHGEAEPTGTHGVPDQSRAHSDHDHARSTHDAPAQVPHHDTHQGHDGAAHTPGETTGSHTGDGGSDHDHSPEDAADAARDAEFDDLGYPAATRARGEELAGQIEQGDTPRKDSVRDTEANQRGLRQLEDTLKDPRRTPEERARIRKQLADELRAESDPAGNLERDLDHIQTKADGQTKPGADRTGETRAGTTKTDKTLDAIPLIGRGDALGAAAARVRPVPGKIDVIVHSDGKSFVVKHNGREIEIDHRSLATYIRKNGGGNQDIRLISCSSGESPSSVAQHLANKLGVKVTAPSDTLWIHPDGSLSVGKTPDRNTGGWNSFEPGNRMEAGVDAPVAHSDSSDGSAMDAGPRRGAEGPVAAGGKSRSKPYREGTTRKQAFDQLAGSPSSKSSFRKYIKVLEEYKILGEDFKATREKASEAMIDPSGKTPKKVRRELKKHFEDEIIKRVLQEKNHEDIVIQAHNGRGQGDKIPRSSELLDEIAAKLALKDRTNLYEAWANRWHLPTKEPYKAVPESQVPKQGHMDGNRRFDFVEVKEGVATEVKSHRGKLTRNDKKQHEDFMEAISRAHSVRDEHGVLVPVREVVYVFLHEEGVIRNADWIRKTLEKHPDQLTIHVHGKDGSEHSFKYEDLADFDRFVDGGRDEAAPGPVSAGRAPMPSADGTEGSVAPRREPEGNPRLTKLMADHPVLKNTLEEVPDAYQSLLKHPEAIDVLEEAFRIIKTEGAKTVASTPKPTLETPLSTEQRALGRSVAEATPGSKVVGDRVEQVKPRQPTKEGLATNSDEYLESLYEQAAAAQRELTSRTEQIAHDTHGDAHSRPGPKQRARSKQKIDAEYRGDASQLLDLAGTKIAYKTLDELYKGLATAVEVLGSDVVYIKDRFVKPADSGYRDILLNVRMSNGHIAELRLHLESIDKFAGIEHASYEVRRSIEAIATARPLGKRALTTEERALIKAINQVTIPIFEDSLKKGLPTRP